MQKNNLRVKISDIASRAGVSTGTVDRVIHNRGEVAAKTRDKIIECLREMNYETDILASTLASKKNYRFVALLPEANQLNPFWQAPVDGMEDAATEIKHFGITIDKYYFSQPDENDFEQKLKRICKEKPSGVVIVPAFSDVSSLYISMLMQSGIPVVCLNTKIDSHDITAFIGQDSFQGGSVAAQLLDYGLDYYADIFIINILGNTGDNSHILNREKGFRRYFASTGNINKHRIETLNLNPLSFDEPAPILQDKLGSKNAHKPRGGIFVTNSKVYLVASWLQKNHATNYKLIGFDLVAQNLEFLKKGVINFLLSQQPRNQGYKSIMALFNTVVLKKSIAKNQLLPIDIISKENIDFYSNY